jgi:uncharacterized RDD family membrane protein YckC
MQQVKLDTGFNIEVDFEVTPFHKRMLAWVLDSAILLAWYFIVGRLMLSSRSTFPMWIWVLYALPPFLYHLLCEIFLNGQSVGKKAMGIRVISADGGQPSISQYLVRWMFRIIDIPLWIFLAVSGGAMPWWFVLFLFAGLGCVLLTPYSQRTGDLAAGTIIIEARIRATWQDTVFTELESDYQPRYPKVMQLSDKDVNTLKSIIDVVRKKNDYDLSSRIAERIRSKLQIESDQDSLDFLVTLLKDYNYYSAR